MSIIWESAEPIKIFYCYAHEDEALQETLEKHLRILKRQGYIVSWYDRMINAGKEWDREIDTHLNTAQIILLLVSPDFMDSDYCFNREMQRALERHRDKDAFVIPIILRPVYWKDAPFSKLQVLPKDGIPVTKWPDRDEAFENITQGIVKVVKELLIQQANSTYNSKRATDERSGLSAPAAVQKRDKHWYFSGQLVDEQVYMVVRKHWSFLIQAAWPFLGTVATLFVVLILAVVAPSFLGGQWLLIKGATVVAMVATGIWFAYKALIIWWFETYILTNKRIVHTHGLLQPTRRVISLESFQQIAIEITSLSGLLLEYGNVRLYLANGEHFFMKDIPYPRRVRDAIMRPRFGDRQETKTIQE